MTKGRSTGAAKRKPGRPATPPDVIDAKMRAVCERIAGGQLGKHAAEAEGTTQQRIHEWALRPEYSELYARARIMQAHVLADDAVAIADGSDLLTQVYAAGIKEVAASIKAEGGPFATQNADRVASQLSANLIQRDRLRLDARKWLTSKIAPKLYGDKLDVTSDGKPLPPAQVIVIGNRRVEF